MRPAVRTAFVPFNAPLEGVCSWMYLDVKGLVTTSIGILIDPMEYAIGLPWLLADGSRASEEDVRAEWSRIKARKDWRMRGGGVFKSIALLHLDEAGILSAVSRKLTEMDRHIARRFDGYEEWPADAQLGILSMSWALGPAFRFPRLEAAVRAGDWLLAAEECTISTAGNPGVKPRNERNRVLFRNASVVASRELDPARLYWPRDMMYGPVDQDAPTMPALPDSEPLPIVHPMVPLGRAVLDGDLPANDDDPDAA